MCCTCLSCLYVHFACHTHRTIHDGHLSKRVINVVIDVRTFFDDAHFAGTGDTTAYTIQLHAVPIGPKRCGNEAVER